MFHSELKFRSAALALALTACAYAQHHPNRPLTYEALVGRDYYRNRDAILPTSIPADAGTRYAGMSARVGTWRATDRPIWWNFDTWNRAEALDAFWALGYNPGAKIPLGWTGTASMTTGTYIAGTTSQVYRDTKVAVLNYARYLTHGAAVAYVREDPQHLPMVMAGAFLQALNQSNFNIPGGPKGLQHRPDATWLNYSQLGYDGSQKSQLSGYSTIFNPFGFIADAGAENVGLGHREWMLDPYAISATAGDVIIPGNLGFGFAGYDADANATYIERNRSSIISYTTEPLKALRMWPAPGYIPREILNLGASLVDGVQTIRCSISAAVTGLAIDGTKARITVKRNGVPVAVTGQRKALNLGMVFDLTLDARDTRNFTALSNATDYYEEGIGSAPAEPPEDATYEVTVENLVWLNTGAGGTMGVPLPPSGQSVNYSFIAFSPHRKIAAGAAYSPKTPIIGLSTRARIGQGSDVVIAGFVVEGTEPLRVAVRAQGAGLRRFGLTDTAQSPTIEVFQGQTLLGSNADWRLAANADMLAAYGLQPTVGTYRRLAIFGSYALSGTPANNARQNAADAVEGGPNGVAYRQVLDPVTGGTEPAVITTLMPGAYTVVVRDNGSGGVGVVEAFNVDQRSNSRLVSVATRARVGTGADAMIAGFVVQAPQTVVVRSLGPGLTALGVAGACPDTTLRIVASDGTVIATNDDWDVAGNERLKSDLATYKPFHPKEAAKVITLPAGGYTVIIEGKDNAVGVATVEVFAVNTR